MFVARGTQEIPLLFSWYCHQPCTSRKQIV